MSTVYFPILFISFFKSIDDGSILEFIFSRKEEEISFCLIDAYKSPFSFVSLKKTRVLLLILSAIFLNSFLIFLFFLFSSSLFLFTNSIFSLFDLNALPWVRRKFLAYPFFTLTTSIFPKLKYSLTI